LWQNSGFFFPTNKKYFFFQRGKKNIFRSEVQIWGLAFANLGLEIVAKRCPDADASGARNVAKKRQELAICGSSERRLHFPHWCLPPPSALLFQFRGGRKSDLTVEEASRTASKHTSGTTKELAEGEIPLLGLQSALCPPTAHTTALLHCMGVEKKQTVMVICVPAERVSLVERTK
jgi:hypothetical protein